jgi:hypothetical protein
VTPAVATLQRVVGGKLLALDAPNVDCSGKYPIDSGYCGVRLWLGAGFYPEMNIAYGVDELGLHDPVIPQAYFDAWPVPNAMQATTGSLNLFAPAVGTVELARDYGVSYVLYQPSKLTKPPTGMRLVATVAGEQLYQVPGSTRFSFESTPGSGADRVLSSSHPGDARYVVDVRAEVYSTFVARITDVPGWHATVDGKPAAIVRYVGDLMTIAVPPGTHTIVLHYWPARFTEGIVLAIAAVVVLLAWALLLAARRRGWLRRGRAPVAAPDLEDVQ